MIWIHRRMYYMQSTKGKGVKVNSFQGKSDTSVSCFYHTHFQQVNSRLIYHIYCGFVWLWKLHGNYYDIIWIWNNWIAGLWLMVSPLVVLRLQVAKKLNIALWMYGGHKTLNLHKRPSLKEVLCLSNSGLLEKKEDDLFLCAIKCSF